MNEVRTPASSLRRQLSLLRYVGPHWRGLIVLVMTLLVNVGLDLLRPWPLKLLIDNVLGNKPIPHVLTLLPGTDGRHGLLVWVVGATVAVFLVGTLVGMVYTYTSLRLGQEMTYDLGGDLFRHLQGLSLLFHRRRPVGDMIARVTGDSYCLSTLVTEAVVPVVRASVLVTSMFVVMWLLQPTLTLLAVAVIPFMVLVIKVLGRPMKERTRERRDLEGRLMSTVEQTLTSVPAVQAFTREELEHRQFRKLADRTVSAYIRATFAGMWFELAAGLVMTVGTAAVFYVGAQLALHGELTIGTIIVFTAYLSSLYDPIDSMTHTTQTVQVAFAQADRVLEIFDTAPEVRDRPHARAMRLAGAVRYEDVTFGYEAGRPVLKGISLEAQPGDVVAIVGPTGAGKTTLANLLVRFFDPWSGRITIGGRDIRDIRINSLRRQIALVLQDPFIFPLTIADNIAYGKPHARPDEIHAAARAANADEFIRRLPEGYDTLVGEHGATLSGGEKQRLSIARAFLKDAPLLILDEPTSALDARTEALLLEALERLMRGRITVVIAHRLSLVRGASQILVLRHGEIVERGTHDGLLAHDDVYANLYAHQVGAAKRRGAHAGVAP